MKLIILVCSLILLGDAKPRVVEKAVPIISHGILHDCKPVSGDSSLVTCGGDDYTSGWTCNDKTRVLVERVNGELLCISPEALETR